MKAHDPIKEFAAKQLGIPVEQVTAEQRKQFKSVAYMYLYSSVSRAKPVSKE